jgi:hypothetical protein
MVAVVSAIKTLYGSTREVFFKVAPQDPTGNVTAPASYLVSVAGTTQAGQTFSSKNSASLLIDPPATIQSITPNTAAPGQNIVVVTIKGAFSHFSPLISHASFGQGIAVGGAAAGAFGPIKVLDSPLPQHTWSCPLLRLVVREQ